MLYKWCNITETNGHITTAWLDDQAAFELAEHVHNGTVSSLSTLGATWAVTNNNPGESFLRWVWETRTEICDRKGVLVLKTCLHGKPVGIETIDFSTKNGRKTGEICSWILPEHTGKGHGSLTRENVHIICTKHLQLAALESVTAKNNIASQKRNTKTGYTVIEETRDNYIWQKTLK